MLSMTSGDRVSKHRRRKMNEGLKLLQVWVPDRTSEKYLAEIQRQCVTANADPFRSKTLDWLEDVQSEFVSRQPEFDWTDWGIDPLASDESETATR